jgi:hypothetical protein
MNKGVPNSNKNYVSNNSLDVRNNGGFVSAANEKDLRLSEENVLNDQNFVILEKQKFNSLEKINKKNKGNIHQFIQK